MSLSRFHPVVRQWFLDTLGEPTAAQCQGWESIGRREHTLIAAPTGSGKTLAAFFSAIDDLFVEAQQGPLPDEVRVIYVSPLKALSADIERNLALPLQGIRELAQQQGLPAPRITTAVRTGDTPASARAAMLRTPPHILVTTPESLYLLLTAERSREMLRTARVVIVDEIHAMIGTRRGAHLALTLERLQRVTAQPLLRIGLSATQKPIELVARYLIGDRDETVRIVDQGHKRAMDLGVEMPRSPLDTVMATEVWDEYYDRLVQLIEAHRTTLIFVNTRRMAERLARHLSDRLGDGSITAHHGSLSKDKRFDAEARLKSGHLRALVATASLELGIDIGHVDLVCQIGSPRRIATFLQRVGRSGHTIDGTPKGRIFPTSRDDLFECAALLRSVRQGELDAIVTHDEPLDVLAQQIVAEAACEEVAADALYDSFRRAWPYRALKRDEFDEVLLSTAEGFATKRGRRGALIHHDEVNGVVRARRGSRLLAISSGGAIPELADYKVVLDIDETVVGSVNEDFAIDSHVGDIFQLGNASWQVLRVAAGTVRVADAHGAPPTIPFWFGEAPARSDELSRSVSQLRQEIDLRLGAGSEEEVAIWMQSECSIPLDAAREIVEWLSEVRRGLGVLPTQETLLIERFFDESGGMQLVLHSPFGARVNRAWGLALRKRFCKQFNFELQAAATDDALLLSLGPQHSFPLSDVFRYLHPATARDVLVQAFLDAPVFQTRWRWNTTVSLAIPRNRGGKRVPPPLQRSMADDLMAAVFPDAAACFENIGGERQLPDHPLVNQVIRDCLYEAMDFEQLAAILTRIHANELRCVARDVTEPSPLAYDILNAKPYAFLDDAPLEERRTHAVMTRRAGDLAARDLSALDAAAIERVRDEVRPDPRDADELHDVLLTHGFLTQSEGAEISASLFDALISTRRAGQVVTTNGVALWLAAERLPEFLAVHADARLNNDFAPPPSRRTRTWSTADAILEMVRSRVSLLGPTSVAAIARSCDVSARLIDAALLTLESEGLVLRGLFTPGAADEEWCERRLLARIHRYTLDRLRAEIEPVSGAQFLSFLFRWHCVTPSTRLAGVEGVRASLPRLEGFEIAADAWERDILPARVDAYEPSMLDALCLNGEIAWSRLSPRAISATDEGGFTRIVGATPIAIYSHDRAEALHALREQNADLQTLSGEAQRIAETLRSRGASFARELVRILSLDAEAVHRALGELVSAGLATSDGFSGLRALTRAARDARSPQRDFSGRWTLLPLADAETPREAAVECQARTLLARYGVVFRGLLTREVNAAPWRELVRVFRRLEARGEIRGGRFVLGASGEQYALSEAVEALRRVRREGTNGELVVISAADPLNLVGIVGGGERIRAVPSTRVAFRDGLPVSYLEGDYLRPLATLDEPSARVVAETPTGKRVAALSGFVGRPRR